MRAVEIKTLEVTSGPFINDVTQIWPSYHAKMAILSTTLNTVSQKYLPPSPNLHDVIYESPFSNFSSL